MHAHGTHPVHPKATIRCHLSQGGASATIASAYRSRSEFTDARTHVTVNFQDREGELVHSEMLWPETTRLSLQPTIQTEDGRKEANPLYSKGLVARYREHFGEHTEIEMPIQYRYDLQEREAYWNFTETRLTHPRAQTALDIDVMLPRELTHAQNIVLVRQFAQEEFVSKGLVVDLNVHDCVASDGLPNPHAHLLIATRRMSPDGDLAKAARDIQDNPKLIGKIYELQQAGEVEQALLLSKGTNLARWRERWADMTNEALEHHNHTDRVDHRTLAAQAIEREPSPHIGFAFYDRLREWRGHLADRVERWQQVNIAESVHDKLQQQYHRIRDHYPQMQAEFLARAREYGQKFWPELNREPQLGRGHEHER